MTDQPLIRISFKDAFRFVVSGLLPALLLAIVGAAIAYYVSRDPVPVYRSTAVLLATRPGGTFYNEVNILEPTQVDPDIYRAAIVQGGLTERALAIVMGTPPTTEELDAWRRVIRVRVDENLISGLVRIEVDHAEPELGRNVANALASVLLSWDRDRVVRNIQSTVTSLSQTVAVLGAQLASAEAAGDNQEAQLLRLTRDQRLAQLRAAESLNLSAVVMGLLEPFRDAVVDPKPVNDRTVFVSVVAFALTFLAFYVLKFFVAVIDPRVRGVTDVQALVPEGIVTLIPPETKVSSFRGAIDRTAAALVPLLGSAQPVEGQSAGGRVVVVTSPRNADERSILACHLAAAYAEAGFRVLLVDADLDEGNVTATLQVRRQNSSLDRLLKGGAPHEPSSFSLASGAKLDFIPAGDVPTPGAAVAISRRARALVDAWRSAYHITVVDSAALAKSGSSLALAKEADLTVLAVSKGRTQLESVGTAQQDLRRAGAGELVTAVTSPTGRATPKGQSTLLRDARTTTPKA